jgi:hypothetical protein
MVLQVTAGLVYNTCNTPEERDISAFGDPLEKSGDRAFLYFTVFRFAFTSRTLGT